MLEKVDLSRKLSKEEYKEVGEELGLRLGELQRRQRESGLPVMVVFEGWEGSGKGVLMNKLIMPLDPRGFSVQNITESLISDPLHPPMRLFWKNIPPAGRMAIYNHSWYREVMDGVFSDDNDTEAFNRKMEEIRSFERQLVSGGYLLIKLFLHIDRAEQKKRLSKLIKDELACGLRSEKKLKAYKKYNSILPVLETVIRETDRACAPWTIIEAHDRRFAAIKVLSAVARALEVKLDQRDAQICEIVEPRNLGSIEEAVSTPTVLSRVDLDLTVEREEYKKELKSLQNDVREMEYCLYRERRPMVIAFEGWDAAGKGGCIKRLTQNMDPRGYQVIPTGAPNDFEKRHHYLWRFWQAFPKAGHVALFDRTWYGRVMVERVEGFCSRLDWQRAYSEINEMEKQWYDSGAIIVKFWLQIDKDEQLRRFKAREESDDKKWKITDEDWRNREKWDLYEKAVEEMLWRTSTPYAPWTIVEANSKLHARLKVLRTVLSAGLDVL